MQPRYYILINMFLLVAALFGFLVLGMQAQKVYNGWGEEGTIEGHLLHPNNSYIERITSVITIDTFVVESIELRSSELPDGVNYQLFGYYNINNQTEEFALNNTNINSRTAIFSSDESGEIFELDQNRWLSSSGILEIIEQNNTAEINLQGVRDKSGFVIETLYVRV